MRNGVDDDGGAGNFGILSERVVFTAPRYTTSDTARRVHKLSADAAANEKAM